MWHLNKLSSRELKGGRGLNTHPQPVCGAFAFVSISKAVRGVVRARVGHSGQSAVIARARCTVQDRRPSYKTMLDNRLVTHLKARVAALETEKSKLQSLQSMEYVILPGTDLRVSRLCLGTMQLAGSVEKGTSDVSCARRVVVGWR